MRRINVFFTFIIIPFLVNSQDFNNYEPISTRGKIPAEVLALSVDKYKAHKENWSATGNERENSDISTRKKERLEDDFLLRSNYMVDMILRSGKVIFDHPVCDYINKVADYVLKEDKELRQKLRFYVLKSSYVNAFATQQGIIFVSLGLLAQIENEAQLAFILSHEIIHFKKNHVINSYVDREVMLKSNGEFRNLSKMDKLHLFLNYSKENESEADELGFSMYFSKTDYDYEEVNSVFDVLLYSYLPFDEIKFNKSFFETQNMEFSADYQLTSINSIKAVEDYDDSESTHPNIKKRRQSMRELISNQLSIDNQKFVVSKEDFLLSRKTARFEMCEIYLSERKYARALYNAYLLTNEN